MEIIKLAWSNERFAFRGKHFVFPPDDIPDRGGFVNDLTLVPRPTRPIDIYQPVTSPETIEYVPRPGHKAVYWLQHPESQRQKWDRYAELRAEAGTPVGPGEDRCLVLNVHVAPHPRGRRAARAARATTSSASSWRPTAGSRATGRRDGSKVPFGFQPTLEDSIGQRIMAIGSVDDVVDMLGMYRELLDLEAPLHLLRLPRPHP